MQTKTDSLTTVSTAVGLNFYMRKEKSWNKTIKAQTKSHLIEELRKRWKHNHRWRYEGKDWQGVGNIPIIEENMELKTNVCEPTSKSESLVQMSRQFFHAELKHDELQRPSSKRCNYLWTVMHTRCSVSGGQILSELTYCRGEQTRFQLKRELVNTLEVNSVVNENTNRNNEMYFTSNLQNRLVKYEKLEAHIKRTIGKLYIYITLWIYQLLKRNYRERDNLFS